MSAVPLMWAQSKEQIIVTFEVHDALKPNISLTPNKLAFTCSMADGTERSREIELFKDIVPEDYKVRHSGRDVLYSLKKASTDDETFWPRLTKNKIKDSTIKVDFDRWRDESDDEYGDDFNFDSDMSNMMAGMGGDGMGMGGFGGMDGGFGDDDEPDSDDEDDMPDLEDANETAKADPEVTPNGDAATGDATAAESA